MSSPSSSSPTSTSEDFHLEEEELSRPYGSDLEERDEEDEESASDSSFEPGTQACLYVAAAVAVVAAVAVAVAPILILQDMKVEGTRLLHQAQKQKMRMSLMLQSEKIAFLWERCNRTTLHCKPCKEGWVQHKDRCFLFGGIDARLRWRAAKHDCIRQWSHLARIPDEDTHYFLNNMSTWWTEKIIREGIKDRLSKTPAIEFWIGLNDFDVNGTFVWHDKSHPVVSFWSENEPNHQEGQNCAAIGQPKVGDLLNTWDDGTCLNKRQYICESKALVKY
ncbi:low affinity immunoglobulin epsilon Fc receptor-like [Synchiropus splendidus]|uniref:low affinity immunoglobulin epsilon Fc receptor-like n=1 Tax=Synchiropus splendidus TaxID=270530 RepID=UPI00237E8C86|nr:low affinity immunoglobulin epsilon Fc receptor-like [Synchiropus splendidus]